MTTETITERVEAANEVLRNALCYRDLATLAEARTESMQLLDGTSDQMLREHLLDRDNRRSYAAYWQHFNALTTVDMYIEELSGNAPD